MMRITGYFSMWTGIVIFDGYKQLFRPVEFRLCYSWQIIPWKETLRALHAKPADRFPCRGIFKVSALSIDWAARRACTFLMGYSLIMTQDASWHRTDFPPVKMSQTARVLESLRNRRCLEMNQSHKVPIYNQSLQPLTFHLLKPLEHILCVDVYLELNTLQGGLVSTALQK